MFGRLSGVSLVDAVAASTAVPGIWPPVTIDGRRYMDGGVRSMDNADLAAGAARIIVISPFGHGLPRSRRRCRCRRSWLSSARAAPSVTVLQPDEASVAAMGANPLDPATRVPAAEAGRAQGRTGLPER